MSKRKKIFHKPDEQVPSAEDILNYLNEENSPVPPSAEKSSPSGGALKKRSSSKLEPDGLAKNEFLSESKKEKKKEEEQDMPSTSLGGFVQEPVLNFGQTNKGDAEKNKKKYELEKKMLAEPLVSEAVEGYALIKDREKAKNILAEINESIASQTGRKNNRGIFLRIAAILVMLFLVSGGSFYLFEQFSNGNMEAVSNKASIPLPAVAPDTVRQAVVDSAVKQEQLAIETDKTFATRDKMLQQSKPVSSDAYPDQSPIMDEPGNSHGNGYSNPAPSMLMEQERTFSQSNTPVNYNADTIVSIPNNELALATDDAKEESKMDVATERKRREAPKDKKVAAKANQQYAPSSAKLSEGTEEESTGGIIKKTYLLEEGIRLYNEGKYKEAREIFTGLMVTQPSNQEAIFYSGMSDYKMQLYDRALGNLTKVIPASRRYDEARWTTSLIYLETGRKEEAIELWKKLSKSNNSYSEKAFEKLKEYSK